MEPQRSTDSTPIQAQTTPQSLPYAAPSTVPHFRVNHAIRFLALSTLGSLTAAFLCIVLAVIFHLPDGYALLAYMGFIALAVLLAIATLVLVFVGISKSGASRRLLITLAFILFILCLFFMLSAKMFR